MKNRDEVITEKIYAELRDIRAFTQDMTESQFLQDRKTQKAVVMSIINIGELSKSYTEDFISAIFHGNRYGPCAIWQRINMK